jgi:hypothetical protein
MSHVVAIQTELTDLQAIAATCRELGLTLKLGQKTFQWWGRSVGDYPLPEGQTKESLGQCDHAIGVPGTTWEIGLVKSGNGYKLCFDFFGHKGRPILEAIGGEKGGKFLQAYGLNKATIEARRLGHNVSRVPGKNGAINLVVTGRM